MSIHENFDKGGNISLKDTSFSLKDTSLDQDSIALFLASLSSPADAFKVNETLSGPLKVIEIMPHLLLLKNLKNMGRHIEKMLTFLEKNKNDTPQVSNSKLTLFHNNNLTLFPIGQASSHDSKEILPEIKNLLAKY